MGHVAKKAIGPVCGCVIPIDRIVRPDTTPDPAHHHYVRRWMHRPNSCPIAASVDVMSAALDGILLCQTSEAELRPGM